MASAEQLKAMIIHSRNAIRGEDLTKALKERMTIGRKGRKTPDRNVTKRLHE